MYLHLLQPVLVVRHQRPDVLQQRPLQVPLTATLATCGTCRHVGHLGGPVVLYRGQSGGTGSDSLLEIA